MPKLSLATLLAFFSLAVSAHADKIFTFSNATLSDPFSGSLGTLTGSFSTNDALNAVLTYNIVASPSSTVAGFQYTTIDSFVSASVLPSQFFQIDSKTGVDELRLSFTGGLTASGGTFDSLSSYEFETSGGIRVLNGAVTTMPGTTVTPEPSSFLLLGTGVLGMAGAVRRRLTF